MFRRNAGRFQRHPCHRARLARHERQTEHYPYQRLRTASQSSRERTWANSSRTSMCCGWSALYLMPNLRIVGPHSLAIVQLFRQGVVLQHHRTLFGQSGRRGRRHVGQQCAHLAKDPWISDRTAGDADAVHAGALEHVDTGLCRKQVAAADDRALPGKPFDFGQELPIARSLVPLLDCPGMHGHGGESRSEGSFEDLVEAITALDGVVQAAPHLEGHRNAEPARHRGCDE